MLDAPVSGGEPKAIDGTLSVMVGGDRAVFDQVKDVLADMAASVVLVGEIGAGNIAKLANQVVVALNIAAVSEALVLAQKAGVAPQAVVEAIRGGLAGSAVLDAKAPMMLDHNFKPGFRINLHHQGPAERPGHLPRRRRTATADRRGAGDDDRAPGRRTRPRGPQRTGPVLRVACPDLAPRRPDLTIGPRRLRCVQRGTDMTTQTTTAPTSALSAPDASRIAASRRRRHPGPDRPPEALLRSRCRWPPRSATPRCSPDGRSR